MRLVRVAKTEQPKIMAGVVFEDIFDVKDIDPGGKKFDRGYYSYRVLYFSLITICLFINVKMLPWAMSFVINIKFRNFILMFRVVSPIWARRPNILKIDNL